MASNVAKKQRNKTKETDGFGLKYILNIDLVVLEGLILLKVLTNVRNRI